MNLLQCRCLCMLSCIFPSRPVSDVQISSCTLTKRQAAVYYLKCKIKIFLIPRVTKTSVNLIFPTINCINTEKQDVNIETQASVLSKTVPVPSVNVSPHLSERPLMV